MRKRRGQLHEEVDALIGNAFRVRREKKQLTQPEVAAKLGLSQSGISDIEQGHRSPDLYVLMKYATLLDTSLVDIARGILKVAELPPGLPELIVDGLLGGEVKPPRRRRRR